MLLVLAMLLSFVPTVVTAADTVEVSPKAGTHESAGHSDDCGLTTGWTEWTDSTSLPAEGQIVLKTNVTMTKEVLMTGDLTICLNGFVVTGPSGARIIGTKANADTTLTVTDCTAYTDENGVYQAGALTGGQDKSSTGGGAIFVRRGGSFKLYDGRITGNVHQHNSAGGGAIMLQATGSGIAGGKFYMYGGELSGNRSLKADGETAAYAGGISVMNGCYVEISGGTVSGNTGSTGGAIYANSGSTVNIQGGKFIGNQGSQGGTVYAEPKATVTVENAEISGSTGSAIYANGNDNSDAVSITVKNSKLFNNAGGSGGAINVRAGSTLNISGSTLTGNTATNGSAIYATKDAVIHIADSTITDNTGTSTNAVGRCAAIFMDSANKLTLSGKVIIADNSMAVEGISDVVQSAVGTHTLYIHNMTDGSRVSFRTTGYNPTEAKEIMALNTQQTDPWQSSWVTYTDKDGNTKPVALVDGEFVFTTTPVQPAHKHNGCNDTACTDHAEVDYKAWTDSENLPTEGSWYLDTDVTVSQTIEYAAGANKTVNICLNGHTITQASGTNAQMYNTKANAGVTITIADCTAKTENDVYTAGKITGFVMNGVTEGSVMYLRAGTTLELFDGIFENNETIGRSAGALMINGIFNMYGGEFVGNTANDGDSNGGAVYLNSAAKFTMTGGTFKNNTGKQGGAIYTGYDVHSIENASFIGNTATDIGGALNIGGNAGTGLTLKSCTFENNTAVNKGGAFRLAGVVRMEDCTVTGNSGGTGAVYVNSGADLTLAGNNNITGNTPGNLYLEAQEVFTADSATGTVGVSAADPGRAITTDCADYSARFTSDDADYQVTYKEGKLWLQTTFEHKHCVCGATDCTAHAQVSFQPWNESGSLPERGSYCLLADVTLTAEHTVTSDLTLCLHGKTITTTAQKRLLSTSGAVTLTITDCTAKAENGVYTAGILTGGTDTAKVGGGAVFVRRGGTLKLYEGILTGNRTLCDGAGGGAVMLQSGGTDNFASFHMYGGEISGNKACSADGTADRLGGGIYAYQNSVFVMEGGTIKNNEAGTGAGIYANNARLTLSGEISGNTAAMGAGVYLTNGATVALAGSPVITGNTAGSKASNLCLEGDQKIKLGTLDEAAKIAVSGQALSFITEKCADYTANFLSDNTKYQIVYKDGALYLDAAGNHKHCFCAGTNTKCDHTQQTYVEWDDPASLPTSGNYYLSVDVQVKDQTTLNATELNLCLNGHTITIQGARAFYTKGNAVLRISDCTDKPGSITGATSGAVVTENVTESKALIELYSGIFTGNENTSAGGAILIQGGTTFNMYGGLITGNALHCKLVTDDNGKPVLDEKGDQQYTSSHGGGGVGLYGADTQFHLYGGQITNNRTTMAVYLKNGKQTNAGGFGGGIYAYKGAIYIHGGSVSGNSTDRTGGGMFGIGGLIQIEGGQITNNKCDASGGGFYASTNSTLNIFGGTISGNSAGSNSGGVHVNTGSKVTMTGGKITGNSSVSSGGGMVLSGKGVEMTMTGGEISGNKSEGSAGGILVQSTATFHMKNAKITGNYCEGSGGGVYISKNSHFTMNGGSISNNTAKGGSGGLLLAAKATGKINGGSVSYNTTEGAGGGVRVYGASLTASGLSIIGNTSVNSGCGLVTGGTTIVENGVESPAYVTVNLYGCTVSGNEATDGAGGGLLFQSKGTVVNMSGCSVQNNKASSSGGGMYVSTNVNFTMKDCKFLRNEGLSSGGFRLNNCTATVEGAVIGENVATDSSGGGFFVAGVNCQAVLKNLDVYGNTALSGGGAVIQSQATASVTGSKFYENTATSNAGGGLYLGGGAVVQLQDLEIYKNQAAKLAGGLHAGAGTTVVADNLYIHHNHAGEFGGGLNIGADLTLTGSVIEMNSTDGSGGGLSTGSSGSQYTGWHAGSHISDCQFVDNTAGAQGGGIYIHRGGPLDLTNVSITGNESGLEGSAILANGKMMLTDVTITDNTSLAGKYALYLTPADSDGHTYYSGYKAIRGNIVIEDNEGGGVYLDAGIPLVLEGSLSHSSTLQVTLSDGVLTQRVLGVYHYEGEGLTYTLTAGDRSITDPMAPAGAQDARQDGAAADNALLYVGVGVFALAVLALIVLLIAKKKKADKTAQEAQQD